VTAPPPKFSNYDDRQLTKLDRTVPFVVGVANVQLTVNSVTPPCCTVIVALVKARSVIVSVQLEFGQPGAPGMGLVGAFVVTSKLTFPFLISSAGIASDPVTVTDAGFWPGGWVAPEPGLVQVAVGFAVAVRDTTTSPDPSPANAPIASSVNPWSIKVGLVFGGFRWTLLARAVAPARHITATETPIFFVKADMELSSQIRMILERFCQDPGAKPCASLLEATSLSRDDLTPCF
jgi:hypothetical protein